MRASSSELALVLAFALGALHGCAESRSSCADGGVAPPAPRCAPSSERARSPVGGPRLVPEAILRWADQDAVDFRYLVEDPAGTFRRLTYHVELELLTVSILGVEPLGADWARARMELLSAGPRPDLCEPSNEGAEVRAFPSAPVSDLPPPYREVFGTLVRGALSVETPSGPRQLDVWVPDLSTWPSRECSRSLVLFTGESEPTFGCIPRCLSLCVPPGEPRLCGGEAGPLLLCQ